MWKEIGKSRNNLRNYLDGKGDSNKNNKRVKSAKCRLETGNLI